MRLALALTVIFASACQAPAQKCRDGASWCDGPYAIGCYQGEARVFLNCSPMRAVCAPIPSGGCCTCKAVMP